MSMMKNMPLNSYSSMKKKEKDSDNFWLRKLTLKVKNWHFLIAWFRADVDLTKKTLWKSAIFHLIKPFDAEVDEKFLNFIYCVHHNNCPMWGDLIDKHHLLYLNCILWVYQKIIVAYLWDWDRRVPHLFPLQPLGLQFNIDQNFTVVHIVHYLLSTFSPIKMKKKR